MAHFKMQVVVPILLLMLIAAAEAKTPPGIAKNPSNASIVTILCMCAPSFALINAQWSVSLVSPSVLGGQALLHLFLPPLHLPHQHIILLLLLKLNQLHHHLHQPPHPNSISNTTNYNSNTSYSLAFAFPTTAGTTLPITSSYFLTSYAVSTYFFFSSSINSYTISTYFLFSSSINSYTISTYFLFSSSNSFNLTKEGKVQEQNMYAPVLALVDVRLTVSLASQSAPGAVCQDPRFIGGDGITFYFHGKKDRDFCLLSDPNLHINAHFIGRRNHNMKRDFTWVQSIAILFGKHQLFLGAQKTATWDDSTDRLALSFDGEPITLPESEGARWQSTSVPTVSLTRVDGTNNVMVEVEGSFRITAKVVPITEEDSRIHNYGITKDDTFAHLDLGFKFFSLSNQVSGVLGQTYRPDQVSRVNIGANMPVMGGDREFETSSLFATDCAIASFNGGSVGSGSEANYLEGLELPRLSCASGMDGQGVVCKR
ncbi:uncharacterized protein Pyn_16131 [Prunus yedoensis var. nudiflora]|uniref:Root cap n=1 Tax=Prunus yedoensis var. nudiflora TaxID=2094558 RepID=A0A314UYN6_PRUYE|nr:uncharacterized protein Pyn_16131 [Prunus yedoensis var. nudiflora]